MSFLPFPGVLLNPLVPSLDAVSLAPSRLTLAPSRDTLTLLSTCMAAITASLFTITPNLGLRLVRY